MPLKVFISCSPEDQLLRKELANHLANLRNQQLISDYYEGDISPGTEWLPQIMDHLKHDQLILLLISSDFMASQFCYSIELKQAIIRHDKDQARVLPILLRPVDYEEAPFAKLQALPSNGVPVTQWPSHDEAFVDVVKGIRKAIDELQASTPPSSIVEELRLVSLDNLSIADLIPMRNQYFTGRDSLLKALHDKLTLDFDEAIGVLLRYSLVQRNERTQFLIIHQLVQKVLKDDMSDGEQRIWAERVVRAINSVFPDGSIATWQRCQNCQQRGKTCSIAEPLYLRALEINVKTLGHNHPYTARTLSNLAELYFNQGRYDEAEKRTEQAFAIRNRIGGPSPTDVAQSLYDIARMHYARGHDELAELFYQYTLALDERALGLADPRTVMVMERYTALLRKMNRDADATALEARIEAVVIHTTSLLPAEARE